MDEDHREDRHDPEDFKIQSLFLFRLSKFHVKPLMRYCIEYSMKRAARRESFRAAHMVF